MLYRWIVFVHVTAALLFFMGHGVSAAVALKVQSESNRERMRALLQLSNGAPLFGATWTLFLVMLVSGITVGFMGRWWGSGWIWASLGILVAVSVASMILGSGYLNRLREGLGLPSYRSAPERDGVEVPPEEFERLLQSRQPVILAVIGVSGIVLITWLMMFKPF